MNLSLTNENNYEIISCGFHVSVIGKYRVLCNISWDSIPYVKPRKLTATDEFEEERMEQEMEMVVSLNSFTFLLLYA
ncbi:hypothetical protein RJT34_28611 [Clitoria ternatea]|uniref:Uncharacterized protein n=1 Tax=Clitoria ternatea TaxID=43366 RepID=A0AAN9F9I7_CLITE